MIAFGSGKKVGGERKWVLDTVLVVADSLTYSAPEARRVLGARPRNTVGECLGV